VCSPQAPLADTTRHAGKQPIYDDLMLVMLKQQEGARIIPLAEREKRLTKAWERSYISKTRAYFHTGESHTWKEMQKQKKHLSMCLHSLIGVPKVR
jgi:hypothetical protein